MNWQRVIVCALLAVFCQAGTTPMTATAPSPSQTRPQHKHRLAGTQCVFTLGATPGSTLFIYSNTLDEAYPDGPSLCQGQGFTNGFTQIVASFKSLTDVDLLTDISAQCPNPLLALPAWIANTAGTTSAYLTTDQTVEVPVTGQSNALNYLCAVTTFTNQGGACTLMNAPGLGYFLALLVPGSSSEITAFSTICGQIQNPTPGLVGKFQDASVHPVATTVLQMLYTTCVLPGDLNQAVLNSYNVPSDSAIAYDPNFIIFTTNPLNSLYGRGLCTWAYTECPFSFGPWFIQSIFPPLTYDGWSSMCAGQISGSSSGVFATPDPADTALASELQFIYSQCGLLVQPPYTAGGPAPTLSSNGYGVCSYAPLDIQYSTFYTDTETTTIVLTSVTTIFSQTSTSTETRAIISFTTTFLVSSTSVITTRTSTQVQSSVSSTTTTTTTTTTSVRVISDATTSTLTISLTFTETSTRRSTESLTETIPTTLRTTVTRTITRNRCDPTLTTVSLTTTETDTIVTIQSDTVFVDVTVYETSTVSRPTTAQTRTRTVCSVSTVLDLSTSIVIKRKLCPEYCPDLSILQCQPPLPSPFRILHNPLPYALADCPCKALGLSMLRVTTDQQLLDAYALANQCVPTGMVWVRLAADSERCYALVGGESRVIPAPSCDMALPVICQ